MLKSKKLILYLLFLLLLFIALDEMANNSMLHLIASNNSFLGFVLSAAFLIFQILAAPIQAGFSDFYCRKKSLIFSMLVSAVSVIFVYIFLFGFYLSFTFFLFALFIKSVFGNILPIARAGLVDTQINNFRFSIGLSSSAIALGYLVLGQLHHIYDVSTSLVVIIFLLLLAAVFCCKFFDDKEDLQEVSTKNKHNFRSLILSEIKSLNRDFLKSFEFQRGLLTYFFWEYSFYLVFLPDIDLALSNFKYISSLMIIGYFIGVILLRFSKKQDQKMLNVGYILAISCSLLSIVLNLLFGFVKSNMIVCYSIYSIGFGFMVPCLFSMISQKRKTHDQGKIYGLIDSTDTIAFMLALITVLFYSYYKLNFNFILFLSFITLLIGAIFYVDFKREIKRKT